MLGQGLGAVIPNLRDTEGWVWIPPFHHPPYSSPMAKVEARIGARERCSPGNTREVDRYSPNLSSIGS